ncbi:hypothetical protein E2C01_013705 [Portunus trituberculatus]|uniref:Uncharacterized protein n=1 Tax=Portunus trituberculatus TaxID=210409 RepID=A0A5B7DHB9_PORTR|nr:hypothetical protein [Portunus trituberculatus]
MSHCHPHKSIIHPRSLRLVASGGSLVVEHLSRYKLVTRQAGAPQNTDKSCATQTQYTDTTSDVKHNLRSSGITQGTFSS